MASLIAFDLLRLQATIWASVQSESDVALPLLVVGVSGILFSEALAAEGAVAFAKACESGLEGIVSSRALGRPRGPRFRQDVTTLEKIVNTGDRGRRPRRHPANIGHHISPPGGGNRDVRSGIVCEGSGYIPKSSGRQLHGPRAVGNLLHEVLLNEAKDGFVFADLACGTAPFAAAALAGTGVARYIGIDISKPSLDVAKDALSSLACPVEFRCQDFVEAIETWEGPLDVV
jgi:hypothetical protein